ncbi:MAG: sugar porter family MFS transporter [Candidatus Dormibacteraeota bacterium]|nr:sugar porter family MFS transporter [Candidatus Dormibacteraeota bacterium]
MSNGDGGILSQLDNRGATSFYWYLAILSTIGGLLFGYDTANIGSVLNFIPYDLGAVGTGIVVSGASLGAAVGAIGAGPLTDRFGRKSLLIVDAGIYAVGALLSGFALNAPMLIGARILIGLAIGADSAIATSYIAEFAPANRRGSLSIIQQWMITVGILSAYIVAIILLLALPKQSGNLDWRLMLGLGAVPAVIGLLLRSRMPESPRWLLLHGHYDRAIKALDLLGLEPSMEDVRDASERLAELERERGRTSLWTPGVRRALLVVCVFFVFQQITGINIPFYYGPQLLSGIFGASQGGAVHAAVAGVEAATILAVVNVIATFFAFRYIDRAGRRPLAIGAYTGMAIFILIGAAGVFFLHGSAQVIVVMVGFALFITCFAIGVGGTGWLIQGEVFPTAVRGTAASIGATVDWLANFALILVFPIAQKSIGLAGVMVAFAVLCILAILFVARFLPETKNLSVEEVIALFEKQAASGSGPARAPA